MGAEYRLGRPRIAVNVELGHRPDIARPQRAPRLRQAHRRQTVPGQLHSGIHLADILALALGLLMVASSHAAEISLAWDDPHNSPADVGGYRLYYGGESATGEAGFSYEHSVDVGKVLTRTLALPDGLLRYVAVTAYGTTGSRESPFSNEVVWDTRPLLQAPLLKILVDVTVRVEVTP